jgi:hypothetical protein
MRMEKQAKRNDPKRKRDQVVEGVLRAGITSSADAIIEGFLRKSGGVEGFVDMLHEHLVECKNGSVAKTRGLEFIMKLIDRRAMLDEAQRDDLSLMEDEDLMRELDVALARCGLEVDYDTKPVGYDGSFD